MKSLLVALTVMASFTATASISEEAVSFCTTKGGFAENVMLARQNGTPMSKVLEVMRKHGVDNDANLSLLEQAYDTHRWASKDNQKREAQKFRNLWESACFKVWSNKDESEPRKVSSKK